MPKWMIKVIYPIDKTDLDMLRLTHFLALATIVSYFVSHDWKPLTSKWLHPLILCGRHSLPIFCLGVFLSFSAHWILTQYTKGAWEQLAVSAAGHSDHDRCGMAVGPRGKGARPVRRCHGVRKAKVHR